MTSVLSKMTSESQSILVKNGFVLVFDSHKNAAFPKLDVLIIGQKIAKVQRDITAEPNMKIIDASGCIVSPGFIDGHRHLYQSHFRGLVANHTHLQYCGHFLLGKLIYSTPKDFYLAQLGAATEAIHCGVTTVLDHSHGQLSYEHARQCIRADIDSGIRTIYCYTPKVMPVKLDPLTFPEFDSLHRKQLDEFRNFAQESPLDGARNDGRVMLGLGYDGVQKRPLQETTELFEFARKRNMQITFHDVPTHGIGVLKFLRKHDLLSDSIVLSHCNGRSDEDLQEARDFGVGIVCTPESEMQMTHGWPEAFRAMRGGCRTGLGVDSSIICGGDLFSAMRLCLQTQRAIDNTESLAAGKECTTLQATVDQVLYMATAGGAEAIHQESEIGSIEVGKRADVIIVSTDSPSMVGSIDLAASLVLHASPTDVATVIINGEIVKEDGRLLKVNWTQLKDSLIISRQELEQRSKHINWDQNTQEVIQFMHGSMQDD
jgi:cytosine/adenosine deaminase-related metal-dependent hydrolase